MHTNEPDPLGCGLEKLRSILMERLKENNEILPTALPNLYLGRKSPASNLCKGFEQPLVALTVQGEKLITIGTLELQCRPGSIFVSCVDSPTTSMVKWTMDDQPYLYIFFLLDKKILSDLLMDMGSRESAIFKRFGEEQEVTPAFVLAPDAIAINAFCRLGKLLEDNSPSPVLTTIIFYELHYLILANPASYSLRALYASGAKDNRIIEAISWLKKNLARQVRISDLAKKIGMSVSSLHRHFKNITGCSPLQYHKNLRLYEAQRLMLADNERADAAALAVGYDSVTQFNREYKRLFGEPPHRDIKRRKKRLA